MSVKSLEKFSKKELGNEMHARALECKGLNKQQMIEAVVQFDEDSECVINQNLTKELDLAMRTPDAGAVRLDTHGKEQFANMVRSTAKTGDSKLQELKYPLELQKIQSMADLERKQWAQAEDEKRRQDAEAERIFRAEQAEKDRQVRIHEIELENKRQEIELENKRREIELENKRRETEFLENKRCEMKLGNKRREADLETKRCEMELENKRCEIELENKRREAELQLRQKELELKDREKEREYQLQPKQVENKGNDDADNESFTHERSIDYKVLPTQHKGEDVLEFSTFLKRRRNFITLMRSAGICRLGTNLMKQRGKFSNACL